MQLFIGSLISDDEARLSEEESWHCIKVLRHKEGDNIHLMDGTGYFFKGKIKSANPKNCTVQVEEKEFRKSFLPYELHIAIAPTKNIDRTEWFVEKAVEIGIGQISFIQTKNSERKIIKTDRILKIVESAAKQSMQPKLTKVAELTVFKDFLKHTEDGQKFIAHCQTPGLPYFGTLCQPKGRLIFLIGPEGDFTMEEVKLAEASGFKGVGLGESRLRTETAALYVCNALSAIAHI